MTLEKWKMKTVVYLFVVLVGYVFVSTACSSMHLRPNRTESFVAGALVHSKLFAHIRAVSKKAFFTFEEERPEFFEVAVGASTPERFDRFGTVRVLKKDGEILRQDYDADGNEIWVDDTVREK